MVVMRRKGRGCESKSRVLDSDSDSDWMGVVLREMGRRCGYTPFLVFDKAHGCILGVFW